MFLLSVMNLLHFYLINYSSYPIRQLGLQRQVTSLHSNSVAVSDATNQTGGAGGSGKDFRGIGERCAKAMSNITKVR